MDKKSLIGTIVIVIVVIALAVSCSGGSGSSSSSRKSSSKNSSSGGFVGSDGKYHAFGRNSRFVEKTINIASNNNLTKTTKQKKHFYFSCFVVIYQSNIEIVISIHLYTTQHLLGDIVLLYQIFFSVCYSSQTQAFHHALYHHK